ncbi:hypothetical protein EPN90_00095 [Patescibacteria group bacterium]|nr:MAG: hypothetical protein EPN90_00095 [Patescibacteria group bacterium]
MSEQDGKERFTGKCQHGKLLVDPDVPCTAESRRRSIEINPAFQRFAGGFDLYQKLFNETDDREQVRGRMHDLYRSRFRESADRPNQDMQKSLLELIESTLKDCEYGDFSPHNFAEKIASSSLADLFQREWNAEAGKIEEASGMHFVNELIAYKIEKNEAISLHIRPTGVRSEDLITKVADGLSLIASQIKNGEIIAKVIVMKSWLLSKELEAKARLLLGNDIEIKDAEMDDEDIAAIQHVALQYNKKSLERYLKTGERPEVRQITMTSEDFISRFLH